jgi:hypothetical protein
MRAVGIDASGLLSGGTGQSLESNGLSVQVIDALVQFAEQIRRATKRSCLGRSAVRIVRMPAGTETGDRCTFDGRARRFTP